MSQKEEKHIELSMTWMLGSRLLVLDELAAMSPLRAASVALSMGAFLKSWHGHGQVDQLRNAIEERLGTE